MFTSPTLITRLLFSAFLALAVLAIPQLAVADINKSQAGAIAKDHSNGKVLKITAFKHNKKQAFRVKILKPSGKIVQIILDAETGEVIRQRGRTKGHS